MLKFLKKILFHTNGHPRKWIKIILFDPTFKVKFIGKYAVYNQQGCVRPIFEPWYTRILDNPSHSLQPDWPRQRECLIQLNAHRGFNKVAIISPRATYFIACMLQLQLSKRGFFAFVSDSMPTDFSDDLYIVICPQIFAKLPPKEKRIAYQVEQSISPRWFTQEYLDILHNSLAVFDYSQTNINYIRALNYKIDNLIHVPIEPVQKHELWAEGFEKLDQGPIYDVIFYGDIKNKRRQAFIKKISEHFNLKVIVNTYGPDLWKTLLRAKIIVNIHYYKNALLETTRICECLSLGIPIVSEMGSDQAHYEGQFESVTFTPIDDIDAMIHAIRKLLTCTPPSIADSFPSQGSALSAALTILKISPEHLTNDQGTPYLAEE